MKKNNLISKICFTLSFILITNLASAQFGDLLNKVGKVAASKGTKALGLDKLLKEPEAITTNFEDVNRKGSEFPDFQNTATYLPLQNLKKNGNDGYILDAGHFEIINKSYCLTKPPADEGERALY